ncbi:hypothetical protein CH370_02530 [Leptospira kmetyi]|uniref:Uncharacterized protein n=1 Tax=Leptospira barantonii TaxID=2023184 RepID=A0ABX4NM91_9LEPT|nr:hypothetical protein CH370_02530 [Leptospira kmetyi]PJZ57941.1 hypothetical protein CH367_05985 [Leptospira barantonii]
MFRSGDGFETVLYSETRGKNGLRFLSSALYRGTIRISILSFKRMFSIYATVNLLAVAGEFC